MCSTLLIGRYPDPCPIYLACPAVYAGPGRGNKTTCGTKGFKPDRVDHVIARLKREPGGAVVARPPHQTHRDPKRGTDRHQTGDTKMASFSVAFNIAATTMPTDDQYDQATDRLAHLAPHLGEDDQGRLEVAISVDADNPVAALADATSIVLNALDPALGVSRASVVHAEVMTG